MNHSFKISLLLIALGLAANAQAQVTFYEAEGFRGRAFSTNKQIRNLNSTGFRGRSGSVIVERGRWEVCEEVRFGGRCGVLRQGSYDSLQRMGLRNGIVSVRSVRANGGYANTMEPLQTANYDYRRRPDERLFRAHVTSAHAVVGPAERRCWLERDQVQQRSRTNVGGAVVGALIGGVLGHQIGGGRGRDAATVGGAVAGAVIGGQTGRDRNNHYSTQVERCEYSSNDAPEYWDVSYDFRGRSHRVQMSDAPGTTIDVNQDGEPRL